MNKNTQALYLVIDQGGQSSRALVFNRQGEILSQASVAITTFHEGADRVEHSAEEILSSINKAITDATAGIDVKAIECAGLACQRSSIVCWDRPGGAALSPVLSWQDRRAADNLAGLASQADTVHRLTGLFLSPHYGASKLRWCLDHLPEVSDARSQGRLAFGPLSSYILCNLLEEKSSLVDPVSASRTLLWNLQSCDWDKTLLALFAIPQDCLPRCVANRFDYGHLRIGSHAVPLKVSTGDQPAALFMSGPPDKKSVYINIGTGAFVQRVLEDKPMSTATLLSSVVWQSKKDITYVLEGTVNGAASALQQVSQELDLAEPQLQEQLLEGLRTVKTPPLFLNGISGIGSPYWQSEFASRFIGEGNTMEKLLAVLESIVFLIQANLEEMDNYLESPRRIVVSGGLSALDGLCQRLASVSALPVERTANQEASAQGLAYLLCRSSQFVDDRLTQFEPEADAPLKQRYELWRVYMESVR